MKILLLAIGGILVVFGLADLIGSYTGFDLWGGIIGIQLPDMLWKYSSYIEMIAGYFIFKGGMSLGESEEETEA